MRTEATPVVSINQEWAIQIFSSPTLEDVETSRVILEDDGETPVHLQVSEDGIQHYLVVETISHPSVMRRVRTVVESVGSMRLDHVHRPPGDQSFVAVVRAAARDDDRAA